MATFITVDYEESQLLERNRRQVDVNRLEALEAQEREKLSRQIKAAVDSQDEIVAGRLRRRRREELAATVISKPERRACLIEVSGGYMTGPAPIEPLPAGFVIRDDVRNTITEWDAIVNAPYQAHLNHLAVKFAKKEEYNQLGNLHFILTSLFQVPVESPGNTFKKYYLLDLGKRKNDSSFGLTEHKKFTTIDLYVAEFENTNSYQNKFYYPYYHILPTVPAIEAAFQLHIEDYFLIENPETSELRWFYPNRGPLSINFPLTINLYPTKDAKAIDDAINGDGFETIIQKATQKNWKQTAVKNYNWSAATTNPPPSSFPQTSFATVKANINKFEFLIT